MICFDQKKNTILRNAKKILILGKTVVVRLSEIKKKLPTD